MKIEHEVATRTVPVISLEFGEVFKVPGDDSFYMRAFDEDCPSGWIKIVDLGTPGHPSCSIDEIRDNAQVIHYPNCSLHIPRLQNTQYMESIMGASTFYTLSKGSSANDAFWNAVEDAQYEFGDGGYTGTIAEKHSFRMASDELKSEKVAFNLAEDIIEKDEDFDDKWGPAGCIPIDDGETYLFFGWASE